MSSIQIEIKKKVGKQKKPLSRINQVSQNSKKSIKIFNSNLDYGHKSENNSVVLINNNNLKTINKLQEELNNYKIKNKKLEEEILQLKLKIKENEKNKISKEEEEKNSEDNDSISKKINQLKQTISSTYYTLIEIIELILSQKYKDKDNTSTSKQIENISMDIYEQSAYSDEEKKSLIIEHIQQILIFKLNFVNKLYNLNLEKLSDKIKQWNFSSNKDKDASFLSFSAFSNNKKRNSNISINNSDLTLGIISPPRSPKFPGHDSNIVFSNIMDESTIKDFSTSIIHYNNIGQQGGIGADSFFFDGEKENILKSKEDIENKDQSKLKDVNLINTSFKDLSIIKSGDDPVLENMSFTKNLDKYVANIEGDINNDENKNKEIFIKNDNQLNISFNDI